MADSVKLSSLRVTADMDVSGYVRAAGEKSAADARMAESSQALGRALAAADAASDKASTAASKISRAWIDGYSSAARFEKAVRDIGRALDTGMEPARATAALDGLYRKFGMVADGAALAKQGFVSLAPLIDQQTAKLAAMTEVARRAADVQAQVQRAAAMQTGIAGRLGIGREAYDARGSASAFEAQFAQQAAAEAALVERALKQYQSLAAARADAARSSADRLSDLRASEAGSAFNADLNSRLRIGASSGSAAASAAAFQAQFAEQERNAARVKALTQSHRPEVAEMERNVALRKEIIGLEKEGLITRAAAVDMLMAERIRHKQSLESIEGMRIAQGKYASGVGLARHELINLSRQIQDVGVSLASGQSPFTVLIQQGTQIGDIFASSSASMKAVFLNGVAWAGRFALSAAGVTTAVLGIAAAVGYLGASYSSEMRKIDIALMGRGRGSGLTASGVDAIAQRASGRMSVSESRGVATGLAATGVIDRSLIEGLTKSAFPMSVMTGGSVEDAGKALADAFKDPAKGADTLNERLGFMNGALRDYIRNAVASGDRTAAQKALFDAMIPTLSGAEQKVGALSRAWNWLANAASNAADAVGRAVGGEATLEARLAEATGRRLALEATAREGYQAKFFGGQLNIARQQEAYLQEDIRRRSLLTNKETREQASNTLGIQANDAIRGLIDDIGRLDKLRSDKSLIEKLIGDPAALEKSGRTAQEAWQALNQVTAALDGFKTAAQRASEDGALQVRSIMAITVADRAAVEADRARLEAIRALKGETTAAVEAENARARVIAEANRQIRDGLRDALAQSRLVGLPEGPRRMQELRNRQEQERLTLSTAGAGPSWGSYGPQLPVALPRGAAGLDLEFQRRLSAFFAALPGLSITSGFRTFEQQAALYAAKPGWAAPPGRSNHERGLAADLALGPGMTWEEVHARAAEFGLRFPMKDRAVRPEAWHVEMARGATPGGLPANDNMLSRKQSLEASTLAQEMQVGPILAAEQALKGQTATLDLYRQSVGATAEKQAYLDEKIKLYGEYARAGIEPTEAIRARIEAQAVAAGKAAEQFRLIAFERKQADEWKSFEVDATKGFVHDVVNGLRQGENAWKAFGNAAVNALNKIADKAIDSLLERLFNTSSLSGGGFFSSLFGGLFGGGGSLLPASGAIFANGAAFSGGRVIPFANGDILSRPTVFPMAGGNVGLMGEAGPEAIMPLGRGRDGKLGVRMAGGSGGMTYAPTINVSGDVSAETVDMLRAELRASEARAVAMMRGGLEASIADEPRRAAKREARAA